MASLHKLAQDLFNLATDFVSAAKADGAASVVQMTEAFLSSLGQEFDIDEKQTHVSKQSSSQLQGKLKYARKKRAEAEFALEEQMAPRKGLRIAALWWVRAGLSDPSLPAESMVSFVKEFPVQERSSISISAFSVSKARDAFCEMLKDFNQRQVETFGANLGAAQKPLSDYSRTIVLSHIHDEAVMRAKSSNQDILLKDSRSRTSSIQNQICSIHEGDRSLDILLELIPLAKKNAATIAQTLVESTQTVMQSLLRGLSNVDGMRQKTLRLVHVLVADGAPTNESAAKRLLHAMQVCAEPRLHYRLLSWNCCAHQANLVVHVAICGRLLARPAANNPIVGTCIRLFKYLVDAYHGDFVHNLREYLGF